MSPEFYILCIGNEKYLAHKLPGELRIIAHIEPKNLDKQQQERYAHMILLALNSQPK